MQSNSKFPLLIITMSMIFLSSMIFPLYAGDINAKAHSGASIVPPKDQSVKQTIQIGTNSLSSNADAVSRTTAFIKALEADDFTVQEGSIVVTDLTYAVNNFFIDSAAGYNAGQYYKRFVVPPAPGQTGTPPFLFRLNPDEAVVYVGKTPPQADYFSFCAFLWSRKFSDSYLQTGDWLFASVGDPLNNAWIKTEGKGNPFQKETIVVLTADEGIYERIRDAAGSAKFNNSIVNPMVLPSNILQLGTGPAKDSLFVLVRTANIVSKSQEQRYLNDNQWARLFRITPNTTVEPKPFAQPSWRQREWVNEEELIPGLNEALERLKTAILEKTPHIQARPLESIRAVADSKDVLDPVSPDYRSKVMGESSDTPYRRSSEDGLPTNFLLGNDDMVVVYGVNHTAVGSSVYSSFAVYGEWQLNHYPLLPNDPRFAFGIGDPFWNGAVGVTNHEFSGSAREYLPNDPMARYLYAFRVVRNAQANDRDPYRIVIPDSNGSGAGPFYPDIIPLDKPAMIGYRAYLNPVTGAGPAYEDLIPDRAIWFKME